MRAGLHRIVVPVCGEAGVPQSPGPGSPQLWTYGPTTKFAPWIMAGLTQRQRCSPRPVSPTPYCWLRRALISVDVQSHLALDARNRPSL